MSKNVPAAVYVRLVTAVFCLALAVPAQGQQFDSDNVVLLAQKDLFSGYNDVWGFVGSDGREYMIQGTTTGTAWWDIEDPTNATLVKVISGPGSTWRDMFVIGDYAYVGTEGGGGIQVVDISDPTDPTLVSTYNATVGASHNIFGDVARELLYVVGGFANGANGGLQILDVSDPFNIVEIGQWNNKYIHDLSTEGTILHLALISDDRFRMIDTGTPANPVNFGAGWLDPTGATHATWPLGDGIHVAITEETGNGHLKILDRSTPTAITVADADAPAPSASAHNVHVEGTRLYVAWYARGTRVYDVSTPTNISEIAWMDTYPPTDGGGVGPGNWGVYPHLPSGTIASNDGSNGLFLFKVEPDAGTLNGTVTPSSGSFLAGATAEYVDVNLEQTVDGAGAYKFSAFPGASLELRFSAFGFDPETRTVSLAANGTTTTNVVLQKQPSGGISGTVTDMVSGLPLGGVEIDLLGTPLSATTDAAGNYSFPDVPSNSYSLQFLRYGYVPPDLEAVTVSTGQNSTKDLQLVPGAFLADFSDVSGWTVVDTPFGEDPGLVTGSWEFGEPNGTFSGGQEFQPDFDHSFDPENQCAVTGNAMNTGIGGDDVDNLITRLLSPVYDLSGMATPHAFYYRWYAVNGSSRFWEVEATKDGGSTWTLLESSNDSEPFWKAVDVDIAGDFAGATAVQFRFTANDSVNVQLVEAALDDFTIYDAGGAVDVTLPSGPQTRLELAQNFPNPFPNRTSIGFSVPSKRHVEISVFDVSGRRVAVLMDGVVEAGAHQVDWEGRTFTGGQAAAGVYFYKLATDGEIRTRKMIRLN